MQLLLSKQKKKSMKRRRQSHILFEGVAIHSPEDFEYFSAFEDDQSVHVFCSDQDYTSAGIVVRVPVDANIETRKYLKKTIFFFNILIFFLKHVQAMSSIDIGTQPLSPLESCLLLLEYEDVQVHAEPKEQNEPKKRSRCQDQNEQNTGHRKRRPHVKLQVRH